MPFKILLATRWSKNGKVFKRSGCRGQSPQKPESKSRQVTPVSQTTLWWGFRPWRRESIEFGWLKFKWLGLLVAYIFLRRYNGKTISHLREESVRGMWLFQWVVDLKKKRVATSFLHQTITYNANSWGYEINNQKNSFKICIWFIG